jgi:hypothetical protein
VARGLERSRYAGRSRVDQSLRPMPPKSAWRK